MSLAINVQSSVAKRFYQEVAIRDKQSIWRFEFRCAAAQKLRSVCMCKRAYKQSIWRLEFRCAAAQKLRSVCMCKSAYKQSIWRLEFRCAAAQKLRSMGKRAFILQTRKFRLFWCLPWMLSTGQSCPWTGIEICSRRNT